MYGCVDEVSASVDKEEAGTLLAAIDAMIFSERYILVAFEGCKSMSGATSIGSRSELVCSHEASEMSFGYYCVGRVESFVNQTFFYCWPGERSGFSTQSANLSRVKARWAAIRIKTSFLPSRKVVRVLVGV